MGDYGYYLLDGRCVPKQFAHPHELQTSEGVSQQIADENASSHNVNKVAKVMGEWKSGTLHSGSKKGPKVASQKQAVAIALSEQRKQKRGGY